MKIICIISHSFSEILPANYYYFIFILFKFIKIHLCDILQTQKCAFQKINFES